MKVGKNSAFCKLLKPQQKAVVLLYEGKTVKAVSQSLKVHVNTVENWKRKPEFQTAMTEYSVNALSAMLPEAIHQLQELIEHGRSEMVRLQAIQTVINNATRILNRDQELSLARLNKIKADTEWTKAKSKLIQPNDDQENQFDRIIDLLRKGSDEAAKKGNLDPEDN